MGLADKVASSAKAWATSFACRQVNSTREFVKWLLKRDQQAKIICPNWETSSLWAWKASWVVLESVSKSTLLSCISLSHSIAWYSPNASPTWTEWTTSKVIVLASTNTPSLSLMHILIPVLFMAVKKPASMLYLRRPRGGLCH